MFQMHSRKDDKNMTVAVEAAVFYAETKRIFVHY